MFSAHCKAIVLKSFYSTATPVLLIKNINRRVLCRTSKTGQLCMEEKLQTPSTLWKMLACVFNSCAPQSYLWGLQIRKACLILPGIKHMTILQQQATHLRDVNTSSAALSAPELTTRFLKKWESGNFSPRYFQWKY